MKLRIKALAQRFDRFWDRWAWLFLLLLAVLLAVGGSTLLLLFVAVLAGIRLEERFPAPRNRRRTEIVVHVDEEEIAHRVADLVESKRRKGTAG